MEKFNAGDRVKMVRPSCYSFDKVGNTGKITNAYDGLLLVEVDGQRNTKYGDGWAYFESAENWELLKEEVKVQKFKVGDKVRMVKLRSDGLSYSFDKIGNEGVVKGIDSDLIRVDVHSKDNTIKGNDWTYPLENKCWEVIEEEHKLRVTSKVEPMCIYSFDSVEDMKVFLKIADQGGFEVTSCEYGIKENGLKNKFRVNNNKYITYGTYAYDVPNYPDYERVQFKVEEEKEMPKCKFKVGDLVKGNDPDRYFVTNNKMTKAEVIDVHKHDYIRVKVLEHLEGIEGLGIYEFDVDPQYFDFYEEPKLVQKEKPKTTVLKLGEYKIVFNGDTTVVTDGTRKGVAKRHPDDGYDAVVGLQVALERFHGGRKPKIGDKVRVLKVDGNSRYGRHSYSIGEIVTVINFAESDTDVCCKDRSSFRQTLIAGEYEVLG